VLNAGCEGGAKMLRSLLNPFCFLVFVATLFPACATAQLDTTWRDPSYQAHLGKIMVIGMAGNPIRRIFEDELVRQLNAWGTDAIASYTVLSDKEQNDRVAIAEKARAQGVDAVLITRVASKESVRVYVPGTTYFPPPYYGAWYGAWPDYYGYGYRGMPMPGYVTENEYAFIETNLYDASNDKPIWAASSETGISGLSRTLIKSYIGTMMKAMAKQGLLGR
jgi:hypothetical protein